MSIFLRSKLGYNQIERNIYGVSNFSITQEVLEKLKISILPKSFQVSIEKLVREAHEKQIKSKVLYKEAQQLLLKELDLVDYQPKHTLCFETTKQAVDKATRFDAEYFQPKYDEIIKKIESYKGGFDVVGNIVNWKKRIKVGSDEYQNEGKEFLKVSDFSIFGFSKVEKKISKKKFEEIKEKYQPKIGEILFSKDGTLGISYVVKEDQKGIISGAFLKCDFKKKYKDFEKEFSSLCFNSIICKLQIEKFSGGGLIPHLKPSDFEKIKIPLMGKKIQTQIAEKVKLNYQLRKESIALLEKAKSKVEEEIEKP